MAAKGELLTWDISPSNGSEVFFSHEIYEKYSLAPSLSELWHLANREAKKNAETSANSSESRQTCNTQAADPVEVEAKSAAEDHPFPEPRVPYPFTSCLTKKEQKTYLYLMTKYSKNPPHFPVNAASQRELFMYLQMKEIVNNEIAEFMKFAQNAAKSCAQDYDAISEDALHYTEELFRACIGHVQKYPEFYTLQEMMSIMGGKFHTQLTFRLEKNLLVMGTARRGKTDFPTMPVQLPTDYKTIASIVTPEKKASIMHNDVSLDSNAEKLALKYCPQVVLSNQSLFTLLNNHGLNYKEQWEIPVCVKMIPVGGSKTAKVVYVDSPLLRKEMTVRERNQIFHEIPMDFLATKKSYVSVSDVSMDKPAEDSLFQWDVSSDTYQCRKIPPPDDTGMDFDDDVTELETFGATVKPSRTSKMESTFSTASNTAKVLSHGLKMGKNNTSTINSGSEEEEKNTIFEQGVSACAKTEVPSLEGILCFSPEDNSSLKSFNSEEVGLNEVQHDMTNELSDNEKKLNTLPNAVSYRKEPDAAQKKEIYPSVCSSDTDEDRLVIDTECKNTTDCCKTTVPISVSHTSTDTAKSPSPTQIPLRGTADCSDIADQGKNTSRKPTRKLSKEFDPVGQILKMQTELLRSPSQKAHEQPVVSCGNSSAKPAHVPQSPKPLVISSTETAPAPASNPNSSSRNTWTLLFQGVPKRKLPSELQVLEEDPSEYKAPQDGNLVYKLFSLNDLLLLVRCSVQKVKSRYQKKKKAQKVTPIFLLPKLEYQAYYGVEALTESEVCQLWTESMLHSECLFYIGHIDSFTSKLIMLEKISPEILREKLELINPANSLNILHHILMKVSNLQEGSYLLTHAAGDSSVAIYKSSLDKTRASYDLHKAHCDLPAVPATLSVPWVPLDPSLPLSYHMNHGRVPCTFPPAPQEATWKQKMTVAKGQSDTPCEGRPVTMETKGYPAKPVRNEGVATKKLKKNYCKQRMMKKKWKMK